MKSYIVGLLIAFVLSVFALRPIFHPGFFTMHDDTQVGRVVVMGRALRLGQFPVRWVSDLGYGYGYPLYNFYGPLPYYVGGALYALGISALLATKIMFAAGILLATWSMYTLARRAFGTWSAVLASILFTYAPYHAVQIYIRGAVGEFWAFAFFPLILLGAMLAREGKTKQAILALSFGIFGVVTSHTIIGYVTVLGIGAAFGLGLLASIFRKNMFPFSPTLVAGIALGLGLSAFFWLPAMAEKSYTSVAGVIGPTANFRDHFVCLAQLWDSPWGFAGSAPGCIDGMSFRLGKPHILLALVGLALAGWSILKKKTLGAPIVWWAAGLGIVSLFLMFEVSSAIWQIVPNMGFAQYPWRFLMFTILSLSLLGASIVSYMPSRWKRWLASIVLIGVTMMVYGKLFTPQTYTLLPSTSYETEEELRWRVSRISDEYLPPQVPRPKNAWDYVRDTISKRPDVTMRTVRETDTYATVRFDTQTEQIVKINKAYFPGWSYKVNSQPVEFTLNQGLPEVTLPKGESTLELRFSNTTVRTISNILSMISGISLLLYYGKRKKAHA